jgi:hypothetical protein
MSTASIPAERELDEQIIAKAWRDEAFRAVLLNDPRAAIEREFQVALPKELQIIVHQDTSAIRHFVLPAPRDAFARFSDKSPISRAFGSQCHECKGTQ